MSGKSTKDGADIEIIDLFNRGRVKTESSLLAKFLFVFYLPFGLALLVVRVVLFILACFFIILLPRELGYPLNSFLIRIVGGLVVSHSRKASQPTDAHVVVANHVTDFDTFALWMSIGNYYVLTSEHLKSIPIIGAVYAKLGAIWVSPTPESRAKAKETMKSLLTVDAPLVLFPEGGLTSGKTGLLMYHKFIFSLDVPIVPAALRLLDPWPVNHDYIGSSWVKNFFWFLLVPFHVYEIVYLPPVTRNADETPEAFARRTQELTASYLQQVPTKFAYADKRALVAKLKSEKQKTA